MIADNLRSKVIADKSEHNSKRTPSIEKKVQFSVQFSFQKLLNDNLKNDNLLWEIKLFLNKIIDR